MSLPPFSHSKVSLLPPDVVQTVDTRWPTRAPVGKEKGWIFHASANQMKQMYASHLIAREVR